MAVLGFTTVASLLKEQTDLVKGKGIESFGVTVIDDADGKHETISVSNAQLHLFMQLKRGNVTHMLFQSREQAELFFANIENYYGKEKAEKVMSGVRMVAVGDSSECLSARGLEFESFASFEDAVNAI